LGRFFSGLLPAGAFFFVALCTTDFISALLVFSNYLLMIFGKFRGRFFRANFSVIFWTYLYSIATDFIDIFSFLIVIFSGRLRGVF